MSCWMIGTIAADCSAVSLPLLVNAFTWSSEAGQDLHRAGVLVLLDAACTPGRASP